VSLYYDDDNLLLVSGDARLLMSLKIILYSFEMMTGSKIKFHKSFVYNLSICDEMGTTSTIIPNCNFDTLSFIYLSLCIEVTSLTRED